MVARLEGERLLSEDRFVESLIEVRRGRGYGPLRIREELRGKGIADEAVEHRLNVGGGEWLETALRVRRKKFGARIPKAYSERAKQARFLQYRGFTADQIEKAMSARNAD